MPKNLILQKSILMKATKLFVEHDTETETFMNCIEVCIESWWLALLMIWWRPLLGAVRLWLRPSHTNPIVWCGAMPSKAWLLSCQSGASPWYTLCTGRAISQWQTVHSLRAMLPMPPPFTRRQSPLTTTLLAQVAFTDPEKPPILLPFLYESSSQVACTFCTCFCDLTAESSLG